MTGLRLFLLRWLFRQVATLASSLARVGAQRPIARADEQFEALHSQAIDWLAWLEELRREEARLAKD